MKFTGKHFLYILLLLFSYNATAQKATMNETSVTYMGKTYKVGDIIQLGYGSNNNKNFAFVNFGRSIGNVKLPGLYKKADVNWSKAEVEIVQLYTTNGVVWARCNPLNREGNYLNKQILINIEGAVDNNEIKSVTANKQQGSDVPETRNNTADAPTPTNSSAPANGPSSLKNKNESIAKTDKQTVNLDKNINTEESTTLNNRTKTSEIKSPVSVNKGTSNTNGKLYFRTYMWTGMYGTSLDLSWIYLTNNGTIVNNPKFGVNPLNLTEEIKNNKANVGTYTISNNKLNITWHNGKSTAWALEYDKSEISNIDGGIVSRPKAMPSNYKLRGQYAAGAVLPNVSSVHTLVFDNNGTFTLRKSGAVSTNEVSGLSQSNSHGTYKIAGNTMWLDFANGDQQIATILIWEMGEGKKQLVLNSSSFKQER